MACTLAKAGCAATAIKHKPAKIMKRKSIVVFVMYFVFVVCHVFI